MPDLVKMFKDMNVNIVHLAEFHGDGHPRDPGPLRLPEMAAMFDECRRLSDVEAPRSSPARRPTPTSTDRAARRAHRPLALSLPPARLSGP